MKAGLAGEPEPVGTVFLAPWSRSRLKKQPGAGAAWKKNQEPEPQKISRLLSPARR